MGKIAACVSIVIGVCSGDLALLAAASDPVRSSDASLRELVAAGKSVSSTFAKLTERIDTLGAIVYVEWTMTLPGRVEAGLMHRVSGSDGASIFWVGIKRVPPEPRLVPILAHELHHVVEALERRADGRLAFSNGNARVVETDAAVAIQARVVREMQMRKDLERPRNIRTTNVSLTAAIQRGEERSATFRSLTKTIERTDWLVFVQPGTCPDPRARGCLLHVVGTFEGRQYLRVLVNPAGRNPEEVIATLAHELQHAVEVTLDGTIRDAPSMLAFMKRISTGEFQTPLATIYETVEARNVEAKVRRELQ